MIGKLTGKVNSCFYDHAIIDVNGVGYLVYCSAKSLHKLAVDDFCQLFIETHVREDHIQLYGFLTIEEKNFFIMLQSVNGIGTKMAISILSHLTPAEIQLAISQKNKEKFKAISGVGSKLAERILIELKDKVAPNLGAAGEAGVKLSNLMNLDLAEDAISALSNLGVNKIEAQNSVAKILISNPEISIDELIKLALKTRM